MRIVFLAPFGVRPKGTVIARMIPLAVEMQRLGHEILVIAPPYTNPEDAGCTEFVQGVEVQNIRLAPGSPAVAAIPNALRMVAAVNRWKPELIHLFKPKGYGGIAAMLFILCHTLGLRTPPVVVDSDDWEGRGGMNERLGYSSLEQRVYAFQEQWLLTHSQAVTAASRELVKLLAQFRRDGQVRYLPNGFRATAVSAAKNEVRKQYGIAVHTPLLLIYSRFFEFSQCRLQSVLQGLFAHIQDLRVMVVGKGPQGEEKALKMWAKENGHGDRMIFCGWLEPAFIPDHIAACNAAIYLFDDTMVNRTKCPAKLVEIVGQGVPVVVERVGQAEEYVDDGVGGYLVESGDVSAMVKYAAQLLHDHSLAAKIGEAGCRKISRQFAWSARGVETIALYESVLERCNYR